MGNKSSSSPTDTTIAQNLTNRHVNLTGTEKIGHLTSISDRSAWLGEMPFRHRNKKPKIDCQFHCQNFLGSNPELSDHVIDCDSQANKSQILDLQLNPSLTTKSDKKRKNYKNSKLILKAKNGDNLSDQNFEDSGWPAEYKIKNFGSDKLSTLYFQMPEIDCPTLTDKQIFEAFIDFKIEKSSCSCKLAKGVEILPLAPNKSATTPLITTTKQRVTTPTNFCQIINPEIQLDPASGPCKGGNNMTISAGTYLISQIQLDFKISNYEEILLKPLSSQKENIFKIPANTNCFQKPFTSEIQIKYQYQGQSCQTTSFYEYQVSNYKSYKWTYLSVFGGVIILLLMMSICWFLTRKKAQVREETLDNFRPKPPEDIDPLFENYWNEANSKYKVSKKELKYMDINNPIGEGNFGWVFYCHTKNPNTKRTRLSNLISPAGLMTGGTRNRDILASKSSMAGVVEEETDPMLESNISGGCSVKSNHEPPGSENPGPPELRGPQNHGYVSLENQKTFKSGYACKVLKTRDEHVMHEFLEEFKVMQGLNHPNIVKLRGVYTPSKKDYLSNHKIFKNYMIITEFLENNSLDKFLMDESQEISLLQMFEFAIGAAQGLNYLSNQKKMVHRDLACRNCLLDANFQVKLCDFGLARDDENYQTKTDDRKLPIGILPLENLIHEKPIFNEKTDIWMFGILVWEIFTRCNYRPYKNCGKVDLNYANLHIFLQNNKRLPRPALLEREIYLKIVALWHENADLRPNISEILKILKNYVAEKFENRYSLADQENAKSISRAEATVVNWHCKISYECDNFSETSYQINQFNETEIYILEKFQRRRNTDRNTLSNRLFQK